MSDAAVRLDEIVRQQIYETFLRDHQVPTPTDLATVLNLRAEDVVASLQRLADGRALVLEPDGSGIRMAPPFSTVPTDVQVETGEDSWWAPCAWDALGIAAVLARDARVITTCADCKGEIALELGDEGPRGAGEVIHIAVPASRWWDDIFFT